MKQGVAIALLLRHFRQAACPLPRFPARSDQSWIGMAGGLIGRVYYATEMNGKRYVLHTGTYDSSRYHYQISRWDGSAWTSIGATLAVPAADESTAMYPNSTTGRRTIDGRRRANAPVVVRDMLGNIVRLQIHREEMRTEVDLSTLPAGTYLIAIPTPTATVVHPVVFAK